MNYIKAQKEVFNALCKGERTGRFTIDGNYIFVTVDGYRAYIFPINLICFTLEKTVVMKPLPIKEIIQDQYELTLTQDLRITRDHRIARRLKGSGKNVLVNEKSLACFQNPKFYQAEHPHSGIVVTESSERGEVPVGYICPIRADHLQGDYYAYADNMEE